MVGAGSVDERIVAVLCPVQEAKDNTYNTGIGVCQPDVRDDALR